MEFHRERFLLRLVAAVVVTPLALYGIGAIACSAKYAISGTSGTATCVVLQQNLGRSTETALSVLLALLGGGALAVDAANQRRREEAEDQGPPAVEPPPTRPMPPEQDERF